MKSELLRSLDTSELQFSFYGPVINLPNHMKTLLLHFLSVLQNSWHNILVVLHYICLLLSSKQE